MEISEVCLQKYAELIANTGAHVQKGQVVRMAVSVDQYAFGVKVMEECYKAGASKVNIEWLCDQEDRMNYQYASTETLSTVLPWEEEKQKQMVKDLPVRIVLLSQDPDALFGMDPSKLSAVMQNRTKVLKPYRNAIDGKHQWCAAGVPSLPWAKKCFPELSDEEALSRLWDAVFATCRIKEDNDPQKEWNDHVVFMHKKSAWLNEQKFVSLEYKSSNGTDFQVSLIPGATWDCAGMTNPMNDIFYIPNLPTEEVFTSPYAGKCEGTLVSTKPLSWNSQLIENFSITFEHGKAVKVMAEKGEDLLWQMIHMDETSCMLGEVALVPKESPVNQQGFLFYNTLYDENACCHCALGLGFKDVLPGGNDLTVQEAQERGINDSCIHVDFMVGSDDLSVVGIRADGSRAQIFENGTWAI